MKGQWKRTKKSPARGTQIPATKIRPEILAVVAVVSALALLVSLCHDNTPFWLGTPVATPVVARPWMPVILKGEEPVWRAPWLPVIWKGTIPTQTPEPAENPTSSNLIQYRTVEEVMVFTHTNLPYPYTELTVTIGGFGPYHPGALPDWAR